MYRYTQVGLLQPTVCGSNRTRDEITLPRLWPWVAKKIYVNVKVQKNVKLTWMIFHEFEVVTTVTAL